MKKIMMMLLLLGLGNMYVPAYGAPNLQDKRALMRQLLAYSTIDPLFKEAVENELCEVEQSIEWAQELDCILDRAMSSSLVLGAASIVFLTGLRGEKIERSPSPLERRQRRLCGLGIMAGSCAFLIPFILQSRSHFISDQKIGLKECFSAIRFLLPGAAMMNAGYHFWKKNKEDNSMPYNLVMVRVPRHKKNQRLQGVIDWKWALSATNEEKKKLQANVQDVCSVCAEPWSEILKTRQITESKATSVRNVLGRLKEKPLLKIKPKNDIIKICSGTNDAAHYLCACCSEQLVQKGGNRCPLCREVFSPQHVQIMQGTSH